MAIKCLYPNRVILVRGNHEFRDTSESQGASSFKSNILRLLPHEGGPESYASHVYAAIFDMFEYLPIAAVVNDRMLVIHGGIGDGSWGLKDLEYGIHRPLVSAHVNPTGRICHECNMKRTSNLQWARWISESLVPSLSL